ncbi:ATP-binding protein [Candidatus Omnitrophota bacterium]
MDLGKVETKNNIGLKEDVAYQVKLLFASFRMRVVGILVGLLCANLIRGIIGIDIPRQVMLIFYVWLLVNIAYMAVIKWGTCKTRRCFDNLHFSYYLPGVLCATGLVYYLGGLGWVAILFYFFDLLCANILMERKRGVLVTFYIAISYFSLLLLQYKGVLPQQTIHPLTRPIYGDLGYVFSANIIVMGALVALISYSAGLFSKMKKDREKSLFESKNRFAAKSERLEEITRDLRKQAAENKYLKRATMGYIEKKEFEIELTKKDLEDQIEKLRKTQKSMVFMIEDLNEMSGQLKDTRDHLEDKVRERTDELLNISRKLHRSERLAFLGKLAGSVTHELRNPLAVLKNAAYFLDKTFKGKKGDKTLKYIDIMKKEITIIDSIIEDIMGFAKTSAPELEEADVREILKNVISTINVPELVEIRKDFQDVPKIKIDSNQVMHALMNIANNAIIAMKGNGTLTFRVLERDDCVCVEVKDTGSGIPPDQRDLIFEPLYSAKPKGTGLGLPIAKMMIENQDGRIEFESELGEGTVFKIYLPIHRKGRG